MKKKEKLVLVGVIIYFTLSNKIECENLPNFSIVISEIKQLGIRNQNFPYPPELTPLVWKQPNGQRLYVLSTAWSYLCRSQGNILNSSPSSPLVLSYDECQLVTLPDVYHHIDGSTGKTYFKNPAIYDQFNDLRKDWKRTYDGILGFYRIGDKIIAVRHNENVNHMYPPSWTNDDDKTYVYQNTVQDTVPSTAPYRDTSGKFWPNGCASGFYNGVYQHCWDSFQNFVSMLHIDYPSEGWVPKPQCQNPDSDSSIQDLGPIIWPHINYRGIYDGQGNLLKWRSAGFYQPTLFVDESKGYIYVFFKNPKYGGYCTGAARASISSMGTPHSWYFFDRSRNAFDILTLPQGFTKENIRDYYDTVTGYKSDCIVDENDGGATQPQYFNVASIIGTKYYLAVEERSNTQTNDWMVGVRISTDLVNWSSLVVISSANCGPGSGGWGCGYYAYPTFLDKDGSTNYKIHPDEYFYILGTHATLAAGYELSAIKLAIRFPPPEEKLIPIVKQYYGEFLDNFSVNINDPEFRSYVAELRNCGCQKVQKSFMNTSYFVNNKKNNPNFSNRDYVKLLYRAVLSRNPEQDPEGVNWWTSQLDNGYLTRDSILDKMWEVGQWEPPYVCRVGRVLTKYLCDLNYDGAVNGQDVKVLLIRYLGSDNEADFNGDSKVNTIDFGIMKITMQ